MEYLLGGPCHAFFNRHAYTAYSRLLSAHPDCVPSGKAPCHSALNRHAHITSGRLLLTPSLVHPSRKRPYNASLSSTRLRRLQPSTTSAPSWYISREGLATLHCIDNLYVTFSHLFPAHPIDLFPGRSPCHASLYRYAYAASDRLLPANPVGASPERDPCDASSLPRPPPAVSYQCTQMIHLSRETPATPPHFPGRLWLSPTGGHTWCISRDGPLLRFPSSARLRRIRPSPTGALVGTPPLGGSSAMSPFIDKPSTPPAVIYQRTQLVHLPKEIPAAPPHFQHHLWPSPIGVPS